MYSHHKLIRILLPGILLASSLVGSGVFAKAISGEAPDFTLKSNSGSNIKLSEHRGEVVLINFWAAWCGPCRQEMPELDKLYAKYRDLGFTIFGVNVEENNADALKIIEEDNISFPVLFDSENTVSRKYNVEAMPTTILVDRDGNLRYLHRAYKPGDIDTYRKWVRELIRE